MPNPADYRTKSNQHVYDRYLKRDEDSTDQRQLTKEIRVFGFSVYFLLFLIITKSLYILAETIYNSIVVDGNSTLDLTQENLQNIQDLGLLVSTTGFILLILPLIYKLSLYVTIKDVKNAFLRVIFIVVSSFFIFLVTYTAFERLTDYIIEKAKNERYDAYYLTMLKNGILNNILGYSSFIVDRNTTDGKHDFSIEDKVVGLNLYLLLFVDDKVIQNMVDHGVDNIYRFQLKKFIERDYAGQEQKIINLASRVRYFWHKYNLLKTQANEEISHLQEPIVIEQTYNRFMETLKEEYELYKFDKENLKNSISISLQSTPKDASELQIKWEKRHGTVDIDIDSFENYLKDESVKLKMAALSKDTFHTRLGYEFNGTFESFIPYYNNSIDLLSDAIIYREVEKKLNRYGLKKVSLQYDWESFIAQPFIEDLLKKRIQNDELRANVLSIVKDRDLERFYNEIYLPEVEKQLKKSLYISKESFLNDPASQKIGDDALKLLYIPPLAIFFSSIFGLLNMIILIAYIFVLFWWYYKLRKSRLDKRRLYTMRGSFFGIQLLMAAVLIYLPIQLSAHKTKNYPLLDKLFHDDAKEINKTFLLTMQWLISAEPIIYTVGKYSREELLSPEFLDTYGIQSDKTQEK